MLIPGFVPSPGVVFWRACDNPALSVHEQMSNRRQPPLSRVAAGSAARSLLALPSQSPARHPWERKRRRRQAETESCQNKEMALAFSSVRSGLPLFLVTVSLSAHPPEPQGFLLCLPLLLACRLALGFPFLLSWGPWGCDGGCLCPRLFTERAQQGSGLVWSPGTAGVSETCNKMLSFRQTEI